MSAADDEQAEAPGLPVVDASDAFAPSGDAPGSPPVVVVAAPVPISVPAPDPAPALVPAPAPREYRDVLRALADRLVDAQRPIRILQALRWDGEVEEAFLRSDHRDLPEVTYASDLGFDPDAKLRELDAILTDAERDLGLEDPLAVILRATAAEYQEVVRMLLARGTRGFYESSTRLFGSTKDLFPDGVTRVRDLGHAMRGLLRSIWASASDVERPRDIRAEAAAAELNARFDRFFAPKGGRASLASAIRVEVDDTLLADAAAGTDYVKIRAGAMFSSSDIDILEAHEGWVHVATSLNGQAQPVASWLAKGPPRTTAAQEGLAALVEIFTLRSTPRRAKKLNDRILAVEMAEDGATFLDVFEWYRTEGYDEDACFQGARRVFRGGLLTGGAPFTKDACYGRGIVLNYAFMRAALERGRPELIPFLFVGKVAHEDVPVLHEYVADGIVEPPPFLPPIFGDLGALAVWLSYSSFLTGLGGPAITEHYAKLIP